MAVNVYPDAATSGLLGTALDTPVPLSAGTSMSAFAPLAPNLGPDPAHSNLLTSFIRISMSGAASASPPQVAVVAGNPAAATEGAPVVITGTTFPGNALLDGTNSTDAAYGYFEGPHPNNVYRLKVVIAIPGTTLKIRITNTTVSNRDFVWVIADTDASSQQPWIQVTPAALSFVALINQTSSQTAQSLQITNRGTGALTVSGTTPAVAAPYTSTGLPIAVGPNPAVPANVTVGFDAPAVIGDVPPATFTFDGDPRAVAGAGHNRQFSLTATAHAVEVGLALDDSGSMSWAPNGTDPPPPGVASRWSELQSAVKLFLPLLGAFAEGKGNFGIVKFPGRADRPITDLTSYDFFPGETAKPIQSAASMAALNLQIDAAVPFYQGTPMFYALERLLTAVLPYYATDPASRDRNSRWLLLMSDGAWNSSPDPRGKLPALVTDKIKVFAAGYGTAGEVDYATLVALSIGPGTTPGGQALQVDAGAGYTATALANAFKASIKTGLTSISSPADPTNILRTDAPEARHQVAITPYDTRAAFLIDWNKPDAGRMVFQLLTPTCELLTPGSVEDDEVPGVSFTGDLRHQLYVIDETYLRNSSNPSRSRFGVWELIVSSPELSDTEFAEDSEQYAYDVLVESALQMVVNLDRERYYAGDSIGVSVKLTVNGLPITDAAVKLKVTAPGQAMANWLAAAPVSLQEYKEAAEALAEKDASAIYVKAYAANQKGLVFENPADTTTIPALDTENRGLYTATFSQTATPDSYTLVISAVGTTEDGVLFRRERTLQVVIGVRPDAQSTLLDLVYERVLEDPSRLIASVHITPRDRFGNVVLLDPATSSELVLFATGGEVTGELSTRYDGTYAATLVHGPDASPMVTVKLGGEEVIKSQALPPVSRLRYADQVVEIRAGGEAEIGSNQHNDPRDALGEVLKKDHDTYVSLGAYGVLAVAVRGQSILAQGDNDLTVFVQPLEGLRPYLVEALSVDGGKEWIELGRSAGVTSSFSLREVGIRAARAVRISDLSGRTRDAAFNPIPSPGVSIHAVGFAKVGRKRWSRWPWRRGHDRARE